MKRSLILGGLVCFWILLVTAGSAASEEKDGFFNTLQQEGKLLLAANNSLALVGRDIIRIHDATAALEAKVQCANFSTALQILRNKQLRQMDDFRFNQELVKRIIAAQAKDQDHFKAVSEWFSRAEQNALWFIEYVQNDEQFVDEFYQANVTSFRGMLRQRDMHVCAPATLYNALNGYYL